MAVLQNIYRALSPGAIVELSGYTAACGLAGKLYAYLDFAGPTGTARDALAEGMLALAAEKGHLAAGQPLVEAVSPRIGSSFGMALTLAGLTAGHPVYLAAPEDTPAAWQESLQRLGAKLLLSPAKSRFAGAQDLAKRAAEEYGWYYTDWLANDDNPEFHRRATGSAIAKAIVREGSSLVDAVMIGVGSGGTVTGVGETVKAWTNDVRVVAVEPYESRALSGGFTGPHAIPEIGFGFVPENYNSYVVDNVVAVSGGDAARAALTVLRADGIPAAPCAGATLWAAHQLLASGKSKAALCIFNARILCGT
jgi:cysteine synthase A